MGRGQVIVRLERLFYSNENKLASLILQPKLPKESLRFEASQKGLNVGVHWSASGRAVVSGSGHELAAPFGAFKRLAEIWPAASGRACRP